MRKVQYLFYLLLFAGLLIGLISCGSKEKDRALKYIKELNEYINSTDFQNLTYGLINNAIVKDATGEVNFDNAKFAMEFNNVLEKKKEEIAKKSGFKDSKEAESLLEKLKEEREIKEQTDFFKNELKKIQEEFEKEGLKKVEKMRETIKQEEESKQNFNPETGEVYGDETTGSKSKDKGTQSDKKDIKEPQKEKKEIKEIPTDKKENKPKPVEKPNNGKTEHPEDNLP